MLEFQCCEDQLLLRLEVLVKGHASDASLFEDRIYAGRMKTVSVKQITGHIHERVTLF